MARLFSVVMFCLLYPAIMWGQEIKGVIKNRADRQPLPGVTVQIENTSMGHATDADGRFSFTGLQEGKYTLRFTCVGMKTLEKKISLSLPRK